VGLERDGWISSSSIAPSSATATIQVRQFLWLVNAANYTVVAGQNYNDDHLMRGENIAFTLRAKVIPYKPVP
jgi:hypothetical protein